MCGRKLQEFTQTLVVSKITPRNVECVDDGVKVSRDFNTQHDGKIAIMANAPKEFLISLNPARAGIQRSVKYVSESE